MKKEEIEKFLKEKGAKDIEISDKEIAFNAKISGTAFMQIFQKLGGKGMDYKIKGDILTIFGSASLREEVKTEKESLNLSDIIRMV